MQSEEKPIAKTVLIRDNELSKSIAGGYFGPGPRGTTLLCLCVDFSDFDGADELLVTAVKHKTMREAVADVLEWAMKPGMASNHEERKQSAVEALEAIFRERRR